MKTRYKCFLHVQIYMSKKHSNQLLPRPPLLCSKGSAALGDIETTQDGLHHAVLGSPGPWHAMAGPRKPKPKPGAFMVIYA